MNCPTCGYQIPDDSALCEFCGAPVIQAAYPPTAAAYAAPASPTAYSEPAVLSASPDAYTDPASAVASGYPTTTYQELAGTAQSAAYADSVLVDQAPATPYADQAMTAQVPAPAEQTAFHADPAATGVSPTAFFADPATVQQAAASNTPESPAPMDAASSASYGDPALVGHASAIPYSSPNPVAAPTPAAYGSTAADPHASVSYVPVAYGGSVPVAPASAAYDNPTAVFHAPSGAAPVAYVPVAYHNLAPTAQMPAAQAERTPKSFISKKKVLLITGGVLLLAVIALVGALVVIPEITATPEQLIEQGRYEEAWNRASDEEKPEVLTQIIGHGQFQIAYDLVAGKQKDAVLVANLAAVLANNMIDNLKDPSTFMLREIYFDKGSHEMILEISANNSMGGRVSNWYDYRYIEDDHEYKLYVSISDMEEETISPYDSTDEALEKVLKNIARREMRDIMANKNTELDNIYVDGINELFESGELGKTKLIPSITAIYPSGYVA